jgi:hypothetical protein
VRERANSQSDSHASLMSKGSTVSSKSGFSAGSSNATSNTKDSAYFRQKEEE